MSVKEYNTLLMHFQGGTFYLDYILTDHTIINNYITSLHTNLFNEMFMFITSPPP